MTPSSIQLLQDNNATPTILAGPAGLCERAEQKGVPDTYSIPHLFSSTSTLGTPKNRKNHHAGVFTPPCNFGIKV